MRRAGFLLLTCAATLLLAQADKKTKLPPDHADVAYGPHAKQKLDLWLAKSGSPTPLVVFIHGGGFVGGDKNAASPAVIRKALAAGVSFASINYRFRTELPIQDVLRDCARAVQFLRYKAAEFHLDKSRVAAMGGSAGAGTSLWLAFHDDLADPANPDPVLRESTRLLAAGATATQATYDIVRWPEFLGEEIKRISPSSNWASFYGLKTEADLQSPEGKRIRADCDMLGLVSKDDPPVIMVSSSRFTKLDSQGAINHTARHAMEVKQRCDSIGVKAEVHVVDDGAPAAAGASPIDFLLRYLVPGRVK